MKTKQRKFGLLFYTADETKELIHSFEHTECFPDIPIGEQLELDWLFCYGDGTYDEPELTGRRFKVDSRVLRLVEQDDYILHQYYFYLSEVVQADDVSFEKILRKP